MSLKNVQYLYAEELSPQERSNLGVKVDSGLIAIETRASKLKRNVIVLTGGIIKYLRSLEKSN